MKDAEGIYALYVQANPVPDPELLPLTRDEAALLTLERSSDMITQERIEEPQPATPTRGKRLIIALSSAAVVIVAVVAAAILVGGESRPVAAVAAVDANPAVEFDGTACSYEGPTLIEEGIVEFSMTNSADRDFAFAIIQMEEAWLSRELALFPIGSHIETTPDDPLPEPVGNMRFFWVSPNESRIQEWALASGFYLLDCATGDPADHVWRVAQIEVVAP